MFRGRSGVGVHSTEAGVESESKISDFVHLPGNNFFTNGYQAAAPCLPIPELHHCFSYSKKVRGVLEYAYAGLWEYIYC